VSKTVMALIAEHNRKTDNWSYNFAVRRRENRQPMCYSSNELRAIEISAMSRHLYYYHHTHSFVQCTLLSIGYVDFAIG
jgi:hypothetical protein